MLLSTLFMEREVSQRPTQPICYKAEQNLKNQCVAMAVPVFKRRACNFNISFSLRYPNYAGLQ